MTVAELKSTVYLLPERAWPIMKQNVTNTRRSLNILFIPYFSTLRGVFYSVTASPSEGNMKPELNQTQAIYPPEGPKPKVCITTAIIRKE